MEHFGVNLINRGRGFYLTREGFALVNTNPSLPFFSSLAEHNAYTDEYGTEYSEDWCAEYRKLCLKNFDLNMEYFSQLDKTAFDAALKSFLSKYTKFVEVLKLDDFAGVEGYYVMVLDEYKQAYIGKSVDIRKRIMQHWTKTKPFDRTLLPMYAWKNSTFSIDFFRALDTTRIYAWRKKISDGKEAELIRNFPNEFCVNRIGGDVTNLLQAITTMKER